MDRELDPKQLAINELLQMLAEQGDQTAEIAALKAQVQSLETRLLEAERREDEEMAKRFDAIETRLAGLDRIEKALAKRKPEPVKAPEPKAVPPKTIKVIPVRDAADRLLHYVMKEEP